MTEIGIGIGIEIENRADGVTLVRPTGELPAYPRGVTDRLVHWAGETPEVTFLAEKEGAGKEGDGWRRLTYGAALAQVRQIGQALLDRGLSGERPVLILSGNGIEHALLALACQHVGVPYAPISAAYSLGNSDLVKLRQIVGLMNPGLVFAAGAGFRRAVEAVVPAGVETLEELGPLLAAVPGEAVDAAYRAVDGDTVAKLLFTSGSTGTRPKAVITTHRMLCANQSMMHLGFGHLLGTRSRSWWIGCRGVTRSGVATTSTWCCSRAGRCTWMRGGPCPASSGRRSRRSGRWRRRCIWRCRRRGRSWRGRCGRTRG